jgi:hypothetical protein
MKASVVHGNLTPRNKTPHRNAKYLRFTPPILPPLRTLVPAENGSLHGIAAIHAQAGRAPRWAEARRCILDIPKFARSSCRTTDGASHPKSCSQFLDSCFASQLIWYESKTGRILAVFFLRGWL